LTDSALREHFAELRRALVAGIDTQTERITGEVRALLREAPSRPPERGAPPRAATWVACTALGLALLSAALWWRTVKLLDGLTVQLAQLQHRDAPPFAALAPAGTAVATPGAATPAAEAPTATTPAAETPTATTPAAAARSAPGAATVIPRVGGGQPLGRGTPEHPAHATRSGQPHRRHPQLHPRGAAGAGGRGRRRERARAVSAGGERAHRGGLEPRRRCQQPHRNPRALTHTELHDTGRAVRRRRLPAVALVTQPSPAVDAGEHRLAARPHPARRRTTAGCAARAAARLRRGRAVAVLPVESGARQRPCGGAAARLGGKRGLALRAVAGAAAVRAALRGRAPQPARSRRHASPQSRAVSFLPPAGSDRRGARPATAPRGHGAAAGGFLAGR